MTATEQVVALERVADVSPDRWYGLTNIFFVPLADSLRGIARLGDGWTSVEVADVVVGTRLIKPIHAARFRTAGDNALRYVVDTTGQFDFEGGRLLTFRRSGAVKVADLELEVRGASGVRTRLPYQILLSDDGYTYARIAEYRVGHLRVQGREYALKVRSASRNDPLYALDVGTQFLADLDGDGTIAEQAAVTGGGMPMAAEQVMASAPFVIGGEVLEFIGIDSAGTRLIVRPSRTRVAAVEGLEAPALNGESLDGAHYRLAPKAAEVTLIEFWSTECAFSERARPAANALAADERRASFAWVAVARKHDRAAVERHLATHPMSANVVIPDSATWAAYNPAGVTPLFVVVDRRGIVRYRAAGTSAVGAVAAKVKEVLRAP